MEKFPKLLGKIMLTVILLAAATGMFVQTTHAAKKVMHAMSAMALPDGVGAIEFWYDPFINSGHYRVGLISRPGVRILSAKGEVIIEWSQHGVVHTEPAQEVVLEEFPNGKLDMSVFADSRDFNLAGALGHLDWISLKVINGRGEAWELKWGPAGRGWLSWFTGTAKADALEDEDEDSPLGVLAGSNKICPVQSFNGRGKVEAYYDTGDVWFLGSNIFFSREQLEGYVRMHAYWKLEAEVKKLEDKYPASRGFRFNWDAPEEHIYNMVNNGGGLIYICKLTQRYTLHKDVIEE